METQTQSRVVRFGAFEVDLRAGTLRKRGIRLRLTGQPMTILTMLLERPGEVITREELRTRLWPENTFVEFDHSLNAAVNKLRDALGDSADEPRFVETLPRRGYRFVADVLPREGQARSGNGSSPTAAVESVPMDRTAAPRRGWIRWAAAFGIIVIAAAGVILWRPFDAKAPATTTPPPIRSLAVLPFDNLSNDPNQEYFADGITDAVISQLTQVSALRVISRTSVMQYRGQKKPLPEIARVLGVDAVVEGTVQRAGDRVRITAQLIRAATDEHLWAESFERDLRDILTLQSEVARSIALRIRVSVTAEEQARLAATGPVNPEAYQLYLQARYFQNRRVGPATARAMQLYEEAIRKDPNYALAHAGLAETAVFGSPSRASMIRAKAAADRALALQPNLADAHAARGLVQMYWEWDWKGAGESLDRAVVLNPGNAMTHHWRCTYLAAQRRLEEAIASCQRALELDPLSPDIQHHLGRVLYFARDYDRAAAHLRQTMAFDPNHYWAPFFLSIVYERQGKYDEAFQAWERSIIINGATPEQVAAAAETYRAEGWPELLRKRVARQVAAAGGGPIVSSDIALMNASLGNKEEALRWLARSFDSHTRDLIYIQVEPQYDLLRDDPRFQAFVAKMNFPKADSP